MTIDQLMERISLSPSTLNKLTDEELAQELTPFFPASRAAYIGPRTSTVTLAGGKKVSKKAFESDLAKLQQLFATATPPTQE